MAQGGCRREVKREESRGPDGAERLWKRHSKGGEVPV